MSAKRVFFCVFQKIIVVCCAVFFGFANAFSANLPSGYTELEYIESTGTQWIDTGYTPNITDTLTTVIKSPSTLPTSGVYYLYGTRDAYKVNGFGIQLYKNFYLQYGDKDTGNLGALVADTDYTIVQKGPTYSVNGDSVTVSGASTPVLTRPLYLFTVNNGGEVHGAKSSFRLYSFTAKSSDSSYKMNLVPAENSSGVVGLYDTVNNRFYTNAGTGEFTAGPVVQAPLPNEYQAITPDDTETYPETLSGYTLFINDGGNWGTVTAASGGADYYRFKIGSGNIVASDTKMISNIWNYAGLSSNNKLVGFLVYYSSSGSSYISVRDQSKFTSISTLNTYLANNPLMVLYKSTTATDNEFVAVRRRSDNVLGYYCVSGTNQGDFVPAYGMTGSVAIKIATTAYNAARFNSVQTDLNNAVATIREIVTKTINQTAAIASLQADKQTRPEDACPAGKKCLLVETEENGVIVPHWFPIIEAPTD